MRAVIYQRVSTDDQAESGAGLRAQLDACTAWASRAGAEPVGPFADEGVSGAAPLDKRSALMDAIASIDKGDVLLIAKRDRLGRDPFVVAMIEAAIGRAGGRVVSAAGEGTESDGPSDVLMRRIVDAFGEYERLVIKARTRAALRAKGSRGERIGGIPLGYRLVDDGRRSKAGNACALAIDPEEQATVEAIRELAAVGLGHRAIARALDERSVRTKTGRGRWTHRAVSLVLARQAG